jgi:2-methylisocitrate lyase-like PEP mutase family enzyme
MTRDTERFRRLIARDEILSAMGAYDALSARLVEEAGGEVVYMSGSAVSTATHGGPDIGLTTMTEMVDRARQLVGAVDVPVFCDADTGYGNPLNVRRTVEAYERAGVAGLHLEDQTYPKKCGHFEGKGVIPPEQMCGKIQAATDARGDDDFVLIARTDARAVEGVVGAIDRLRAYDEAGADVLFFEAPESRGELERVTDAFDDDVPQLVNMVVGGKTPAFSAAELEDLGFDIVLYPTAGFNAAAKALRTVYDELVATGSHEGVEHRLMAWEERDRITGLAEMTELEARYEAAETPDTD